MSPTQVHPKPTDRGHDAVAPVLVDERLDRVAAVAEGLVDAVQGWLLFGGRGQERGGWAAARVVTYRPTDRGGKPAPSRILMPHPRPADPSHPSPRRRPRPSASNLQHRGVKGAVGRALHRGDVGFAQAGHSLAQRGDGVGLQLLLVVEELRGEHVGEADLVCVWGGGRRAWPLGERAAAWVGRPPAPEPGRSRILRANRAPRSPARNHALRPPAPAHLLCNLAEALAALLLCLQQAAHQVGPGTLARRGRGPLLQRRGAARAAREGAALLLRLARRWRGGRRLYGRAIARGGRIRPPVPQWSPGKGRERLTVWPRPQPAIEPAAAASRTAASSPHTARAPALASIAVAARSICA
jgi:hypothetical protein